MNGGAMNSVKTPEKPSNNDGLWRPKFARNRTKGLASSSGVIDDQHAENSDFTIIGDTFFGSLHAAAWVDIAVSEERADHSDLEGKGIDLPIRG
ncbi:hypothetical protein QYF36_019774 [Acer negundo]|nr:hypothetical protein QYF36_019774 [Acer negundo]